MHTKREQKMIYHCNLMEMSNVTLGSVYNEFGYNEHPAITSRFLCIKIIDCNVKKFAYNEHLFTRCKQSPVQLLIRNPRGKISTGSDIRNVTEKTLHKVSRQSRRFVIISYNF